SRCGSHAVVLDFAEGSTERQDGWARSQRGQQVMLPTRIRSTWRRATRYLCVARLITLRVSPCGHGCHNSKSHMADSASDMWTPYWVRPASPEPLMRRTSHPWADLVPGDRADLITLGVMTDS